MLDYNFFYKFTVRSLIILKFNNINNTYAIPFLSKLILFFSLTKIEDVHMVQGYNYAYLFRFFFGRRAYLTRQKSFFNLGKWTYSFNICYSLTNKSIYNELFFLINDIMPKIDKTSFNYGLFSRELGVFYLIIKDLNFFSEQKTNLGLFYLDNNLTFHIFYKNAQPHVARILLSNLKLNIY